MDTSGSAAVLLANLLEEGQTGSLADSQLLERFATGDRAIAEAAFHALVDRHAAMVFQTCRGILGDEHEARDASQATFLILFRRGRSIWVGSSLGPWLHRVASRTAHRARVGAARRREVERRTADHRSSTGQSPDLIAAIHDEIDHLPERFRVPIILCDLEGHTREEAARRIDCPLGTLASRLACGRERLRDRLIRRGLTPSSGLGLSLLARDLVAVPLVVARPLVTITPAVAQLARGVFSRFTILKLMGFVLVAGSGLGLATIARTGTTASPIPPDSSRPASHDPGPPARAAQRPPTPIDRPNPPPAPLVADLAPHEPVSIVGRVVEQGSRKPVAGAELFVTEFHRGDQLPQGDAPTLRADRDGRFAISVPITKVGDPNEVGVFVGIRHPDWIAVRSFFSQITLEQISRGMKPDPFGEITLQRLLVYTARVIAPDGQPVPGIPYSFRLFNLAENQSASFYWWDTLAGQTDAEGRIQQRMPATTSLFLRLDPERFAPWQRYWGDNDPLLVGPLPTIPSDLGQITLDPGVTLTGRLLNREGQPVAAQTITATERSHEFRRSATTAGDGRFAFPALRTGNYLIEGPGQDGGRIAGFPDTVVAPPDALIIRPVPVFLAHDANPGPQEIREADTVAVSVRFVNSQGRSAPGVPVTLQGFLPGEGGDARPYYELWAEQRTRFYWRGSNSKLTGGRLDWSIWVRPDANGVVSFRAPRGLREAEIRLDRGDQQTAYKVRIASGDPLDWKSRHNLGQLDADRTEVEVVAYRSPVVVIHVRTEGGEPIPLDTKVHQGENIRGGDYGTDAIRQPDGSFKTRGLVPDHEIELTAWPNGYVPAKLERINLAEGAEATIDLVIRPKPKPPAVGDLAPPFRVTTLDGQVRSLDDYRGKFLLVHLWSPFFHGDQDLPRLDAIRQRWGEDRLAMLGLSLTADTAATSQVITQRQLKWPQAILRDRGADPMVLDFDTMYPPQSFLIGPDGKVVARDLVGDQVDDAVARSLGSGAGVR